MAHPGKDVRGRNADALRTLQRIQAPYLGLALRGKHTGAERRAIKSVLANDQFATILNATKFANLVAIS